MPKPNSEHVYGNYFQLSLRWVSSAYIVCPDSFFSSFVCLSVFGVCVWGCVLQGAHSCTINILFKQLGAAATYSPKQTPVVSDFNQVLIIPHHAPLPAGQTKQSAALTGAELKNHRNPSSSLWLQNILRVLYNRCQNDRYRDRETILGIIIWLVSSEEEEIGHKDDEKAYSLSFRNHYYVCTNMG